MANVNEPELEPSDAPPGFRPPRVRIGRELATELIGRSLWELPAGEAAYPYHSQYWEGESPPDAP